MLKLTNATLHRGVKCLLQDANITIHMGWHVGIVGHNGAGKSSLFKLILGELSLESGDLSCTGLKRIAHLAQEVEATDQPALEYVLDGDEELRALEAQLIGAEKNSSQHRLSDIHERLHAIDAYSSSARAAKVMAGLGFKADEIDQTVSSFSGGWRMRLNLARCLLSRADLLLLDEPTNHLDLEAQIWLERWLKHHKATILLISHDRELLDNVTQHIIHFNYQRAQSYTGNYTQFEQQRAEHFRQTNSAIEKQSQKVAHLEQFIRRFGAKASKAKQAQSRIKALEKLKTIESLDVDSPYTFRFLSPHAIKDPLICLENANVGYDERIVVKEINLALSPTSRIGLLGPNGAGKSTLLKALAEDSAIVSGKRWQANCCRIGYFAQHQLEQLDSLATPLIEITRLSPKSQELELRKHLGSFGFCGDSVHQTVREFSGGERSRLALALLIWKRPNVLILDEPTNHLDLDMRQTLTVALQDFEGALIIVSHDRHLLRASTDTLFVLNASKLTPFEQDLDDYVQWINGQQNQSKNENLGKTSPEPDKRCKRRSAAKQRDIIRPLKKQIVSLEKAIIDNQKARLQFENELADPLLYKTDEQDSDERGKITQLIRHQSEAIKQGEALETKWLELNEQLELLLSDD